MGSGKSVALKQSSIAKALAVLGGGEDNEDAGLEFESGRAFFVRAWDSRGFTRLLEPTKCVFRGLKHVGEITNLVFCSFWRKRMKMMEMHRFSIQDQDLSHSGMKAGVRNNGVIGDDLLVPRSLLVSKYGILKSQLVKEVDTDLLQPEAQYSAPKPPPFKFHTAGGRSFSVSIEALKRARSLLGDPDIGAFLNEGDAFDMGLSVFEDIIFDEASSNKENSFYSACTHPEAS